MPIPVAQFPDTPTPFPTVELPWGTPTPVPVSTVALQMPGIVPTMVESYAQSAEYAVQSWNTFTNPVSGIDDLLTLFIMGIVLFGLARIFTLFKGRWGQPSPAAEAAPETAPLKLPGDSPGDRRIIR